MSRTPRRLAPLWNPVQGIRPNFVGINNSNRKGCRMLMQLLRTHWRRTPTCKTKRSKVARFWISQSMVRNWTMSIIVTIRTLNEWFRISRTTWNWKIMTLILTVWQMCNTRLERMEVGWGSRKSSRRCSTSRETTMRAGKTLVGTPWGLRTILGWIHSRRTPNMRLSARVCSTRTPFSIEWTSRCSASTMPSLTVFQSASKAVVSVATISRSSEAQRLSTMACRTHRASRRWKLSEACHRRNWDP